MNKVTKTPIQINKNAIIVLHLFRRHDDMEDFWMTDIQNYMEDSHGMSDNAAKLLIEQLQGEWNIKFMLALREEVNKHIKKWEDMCND